MQAWLGIISLPTQTNGCSLHGNPLDGIPRAELAKPIDCDDREIFCWVLIWFPQSANLIKLSVNLILTECRAPQIVESCHPSLGENMEYTEKMENINHTTQNTLSIQNTLFYSIYGDGWKIITYALWGHDPIPRSAQDWRTSSDLLRPDWVPA